MDNALPQSLNDMLAIVQGGGNVALILCVYFIRDASQRLARIETRLAVALHQGAPNDGKSI